MKRKENERRWHPGLLLGIASALVLGALVLAGCGGGSGGGGSEASSTTSSSSEDSGSQGKAGGPGGFDISDEQRACLKGKGIELPEFKGGAGGAPPEGFEPPEGGEMPAGGPPAGAGGEKFEEQRQAFEECGIELGEFKGPGGKGGPDMNSAAFKKQVREYVACVRENGYELAEPNFSGEGPIFEKSESESAAFKQASEKCQSLLGGPGGQGGQGSAGETEG